MAAPLSSCGIIANTVVNVVTKIGLILVLPASITDSRYRGGEEEMDIVLQYPEEISTSLENLENLMVPSNTGGQIPLSEVASIEHGFGQKSISRTNQSRVISVTCDIHGRHLNSVNADIQAKLKQIPVPYNTPPFHGQ